MPSANGACHSPAFLAVGRLCFLAILLLSKGVLLVMLDTARRLDAAPSSGLSFNDMLAKVMGQVEYHCFADLRWKQTDPLYGELCLVMAEVFALDPGSAIKVNGSCISARLAQEVFSKLRNSHLLLVFENFHGVSARIHNKKAYLRTSLYNAVFELESCCVNNSQSGWAPG